jgi:Sigma-70 region 2
MEKGRPGSSLLQLRSLFAAGTATGLTDSELLERYTTKRAESAEAATAAEMAFAALVDRHGAMVWGVCHRVLGDSHEAEDAFQATFLVLVRKAGSVRVDGSLGRWLYGVAHRVARRTRAQAKPRGYRIGQASARSSDDPVAEVELEDVRNAVGEELDRLPTKWWINEANGGSSGPAMQAGKPVPGLSEVITEFPSGLSTCTVLFKVAAGPWHTVQTWGKNQGALASRDGASFIFGEAIATKVGTTLAVTHNIQDTSVQLVAIDRDDKEHPAKIRSGSGVKDFKQIVGEFDLSPDQIKEFRVQTRPFERVEIPGIALKRESSAKK